MDDLIGLLALVFLALASIFGLFAFLRVANNAAKEEPKKNVKKTQQKEEVVVSFLLCIHYALD